MNIRQYYIARYFYSLLFISFGSIGIITAYLIKSDGGNYTLYQTSLMFLGEVLCFTIYPIRIYFFKGKSYDLYDSQLNEDYRSWLTKLGKYGYCIIAIADFANSLIAMYIINFLSVPEYIGLKLNSVLFALAYRVFYVKVSVYRHQKLGLVLFLFGMMLIMLDILMNHTDYKLDKMRGICVVLALIAAFFEALTTIWQELLMNRLNHSVDTSLGIRGVCGLVICSLVYGLFSIIKTSNSTNQASTEFCYISFNLSKDAVILSICQVFTLFIFNYSAYKTLEFADSLSMLCINSSRIAIVWTVELILDSGFKNAAYMEFAGGCCILAGMIVYNELIILRFCGFKESANESIKEHKHWIKRRINHPNANGMNLMTTNNFVFTE
jgi:hypothetical protein